MREKRVGGLMSGVAMYGMGCMMLHLPEVLSKDERSLYA